MGQKLVTCQVIVDDTTNAVIGFRHQDVEYLVATYTKNSAGTIVAKSGPVTAAISTAVAALTTVGPPSLTTDGIAALTSANISALTTAQVAVLNNIWTNNDQMVTALQKLGVTG